MREIKFTAGLGFGYSLKNQPAKTYPLITWDDLIEALSDGTLPTASEKSAGWWIIPSEYNSHQARSHAVQEESGQYNALVGDIDSGSIERHALDEALAAVAGNCERLIFTTASSTKDALRWRFLIPTAESLTGLEWARAQTALFEILAQEHGLPMDLSARRAGQVSFLPNVLEAAKADFDHLHTEGDFFDLSTIKQMIATVAARGTVLPKRNLEPAFKETDRRPGPSLQVIDGKLSFDLAAAKAEQSQSTLIAEFNLATPLIDVLAWAGYEQNPDNPNEWRSPHQTSGSFATLVRQKADGTLGWSSMSESDAAAGVGNTLSTNCAAYGDAFDIWVAFDPLNNGDSDRGLSRLKRIRGTNK